MSDDEASSHDSDGELPPEETLVHGRTRRTTAGNRMSILIQAYNAEDVQNDLLADEEEDRKDYVMSDASDVELESTDESEDEGPPKEGEEEKLDGEQELQKQERVAARKQKRRAQDLLRMPPMRKKVRLTDHASASPAADAGAGPRPRKKSERTSWLPTAEDAPTRQSRRKATVQNKELTEVKLRESQKRSEKVHEMMKIAAEKRAADAVPALTQADRIANALRTEKENSKSLNRWVQVEEERRNAQRKRMEALRNRQIDGPVIRYWSGSVIWEGDRIKVHRVHEPKVEEVDEAPAASGQKQEQENEPVGKFAEGHNAEEASATTKGSENPDTQSEAVAAPKEARKHSDIVPTQETVVPKASALTEQLESVRADKDGAGSQQTGKESEIIKTDGRKSTDLAASRASSVPAQNTGPQPASFLEGIHYWASQSSRNQDSSETEIHSVKQEPTSIVDAQRSASAPQETPSSSVTIQLQEKTLMEQPLRQTISNAGPAGHHSDILPQQPPAATEDMTASTPTADPSPAHLPLVIPVTTLTPIQTENTAKSPAPAGLNEAQHVTQLDVGSMLGVNTQLHSVPLVEGLTMMPAEATVALPAEPPAPLLREQALRTLLTLDAFPQLEDLPPPTSVATTSRSLKVNPATSVLSSLLFPGAHPTMTAAEQKYLTARSLKKKGDNLLPDRPAKASCCITAKEAKFRDPKTGLEYRDLAAFKSLQRVLAGGCAWSVQAECWVGIVGDGRMGRVAKGVPEGFWSGILPKSKEKEKEKEVIKVEDVAPTQAPMPTQGQAPAEAPSQGQPQLQPSTPTPAPVQVQQ